MLRRLRITNFALINQLELHFDSGFTVITGETGSGKSILLSALNMILGERADFSVIGSNGDKSVVEADISLSAFDLKYFFDTHDLDYEQETLIRREIYTGGKSRAFINDVPVSLNILKELTEKLIHIHSQYNSLELKNKEFQLEIIDDLGQLNLEKKAYQVSYFKYVELKKELNLLREEIQNSDLNHDYILFQLNELIELRLDQTDYIQLEKELKKAENSEMIIRMLGLITQLMEQDGNVLDQLSQLKSSLDRLKGVDSDLDFISSRIDSQIIELKEIVSDSHDLSDRVVVNTERIKFLTESLNEFNRVLTKHKVGNQEELKAVQKDLTIKINESKNAEHRVLELENIISELHRRLKQNASELHQARTGAVQHIAKELKVILATLKLPDTNLIFELSELNELNVNGSTAVSLLFSANKGIQPIPIEKAVSGGELSRVMLALQKMLSEKKSLPTILFDEIDTGVSGDVAQKLGVMLRNMGTHLQLIAISHLPQVAAKAVHHFKVQKNNNHQVTQTSVYPLSENERVEEIARLMSGENITEAAKENAKTLML